MILLTAFLADTSVWIDHLRSPNPEFVEALERGTICSHPYVIGELACGNLPNRGMFLRLMHRLVVAPTASPAEVLHLIETRALMGRGIGYVDACVLASAILGGVRVWTRDQRLHAVAEEMGLA